MTVVLVMVTGDGGAGGGVRGHRRDERRQFLGIGAAAAATEGEGGRI